MKFQTIVKVILKISDVCETQCDLDRLDGKNLLNDSLIEGFIKRVTTSKCHILSTAIASMIANGDLTTTKRKYVFIRFHSWGSLCGINQELMLPFLNSENIRSDLEN